MPELRKDPIVGRWVIISTDRGKRPTDFTVPTPKENNKFCPFCYGNEDKTPHEVLAYRPDGSHANTAGWKLRVVPNKFPALQIEGGLDKVGEGVFDKMNGVGAHEVIIETPNHHLPQDSPLRHGYCRRLMTRHLKMPRNMRLNSFQLY